MERGDTADTGAPAAGDAEASGQRTVGADGGGHPATPALSTAFDPHAAGWLAGKPPSTDDASANRPERQGEFTEADRASSASCDVSRSAACGAIPIPDPALPGVPAEGKLDERGAVVFGTAS